MKFQPSDPRLVPPPPNGLTSAQLVAFFQKDLEIALGYDSIHPTPRPSPSRPSAPKFQYRLNPKKRFPNSKPLSTDAQIAIHEFLEQIHEH